MIYDTDDNRLLSSAVDIEQGQVVEGSFRVACKTGYQLRAVPVDDVVCEVKHSAGSYFNIETDPIGLGTWNNTTQTFNYRITAAASAIYKERLLPLTVARFEQHYTLTVEAGVYIITGNTIALSWSGGSTYYIAVETGSYSVTGSSVNLLYSGDVGLVYLGDPITYLGDPLIYTP